MRRGREIFYDGDNSLHGNASCESCHLDVGFDMLTWDVSDLPRDDKGPMFTQSLRGIEATKPYHWRGERELIEFNPELGDSAFAALQAFLFGVDNPANPFAHPDRVVSDDAALVGFAPPEATLHDELSAVAGQQAYFEVDTIGSSTCNDCHTLPTGTNNDVVPDGPNDSGHRNQFVVPAFNGLWRKDQRARVDVSFHAPEELLIGEVVVDETRPPLGQAVSHAGLTNGIFEFVDEMFQNQVDEEVRQDVAFFVHQVDSGLAPSVHTARLLDQASEAEASAWIVDYLLPQQAAGHCDVAVVGTVDPGSGPVALRWFLDADTDLFVPSDSLHAPVPLSFFQDQATAGTGSALFVGLPRGMGRRWGVDMDGDLLFDGDEAAAGGAPDQPDTDGDGAVDGVEVMSGTLADDATSVPAPGVGPAITDAHLSFVTTKVAKFVVRSSTPSTARLTCSAPGQVDSVVQTQALSTVHTLVARDLVPSNAGAGLVVSYDCSVRVSDPLGNTASRQLGAVATDSFDTAFEEVAEVETVLAALDLDVVGTEAGGGYRFRFDALVDHAKLPAPSPQAGQVAVVRVIRNGALEANVRLGDGTAAPLYMGFEPVVVGDAYHGIGPFVAGGESLADGWSGAEFVLPDAVPGDTVLVSVETVAVPDPALHTAAAPWFLDDGQFDLPSTPAAYRLSRTVRVE